jgi:hypothetical protein
LACLLELRERNRLTGLSRFWQLGSGNAESNKDRNGWVNAMDFGRQTQRLGNLGTDGGQRVPAPKDVRGTSVIPSRSPNATPMNPGTARYANLNASTTAMSKATSKI